MLTQHFRAGLLLTVAGVSALQDINKLATMSLWHVQAMLAIKVSCATYVNVKEVGKVRQLFTDVVCSV